MNKKNVLFLSITVCLTLMSWGIIGHQTIGRIASHHLTPQAKEAVQDLLGSQTLASVSTWADDVRSDPAYKGTDKWHYINLPLGLTYAEFEQLVKNMPEDNVYKAVLKCEDELKSPNTTRKQKAEALQFLVHFIGDLHQPMHVSRAEDKGGNTIKVKYKGENTNLHAIWDSHLINDQNKSDSVLAVEYDHATPDQIKQWQNDDLVKWLWESYQISSELYKEMDEAKNNSLKEEYYKKHIPEVEKRIEMAGIRLAGVLNNIFNDGYKAPAKDPNESAAAPANISLEEVGKYMGKEVVVSGKIYSFKKLSGLTLVNLGAQYPYQLLTVVLKGQALNKYKKIKRTNVTVTGKIINYKGKPEIIVTDPAKFRFAPKKLKE